MITHPHAGLAEHELFWRHHLSGDLPILELPLDYPRPATLSLKKMTQSIQLDTQLYRQFGQFCTDKQVTPFALLLAAFKILLHRYTGQNDLIVGSLAVADDMPSVNPIALRTHLTDDPTTGELFNRITNTITQAAARRNYAFDKLVEYLNRRGSAAHHPIFHLMLIPCQASFELADIPLNADHLAAASEHTQHCDLILLTSEQRGTLQLTCQYTAALFEPETIRRMLGHFQTLLQALIAGDAAHQISHLPLLTQAEQRQLLVEWNNTHANLPANTCAHQLFEAQVNRTPNHVAVIYEDTQLTYRQLNRQANRLARALVAQGVGPNVVVALLDIRGINLLTAILAVHKAGGAYLPLDPQHPPQRIAQVLAQSRSPLVLVAQQFEPLVQQALAGMPALQQPHTLQLEELLQREQPAENLPPRSAPNNLAYVIFTSGSTGQPKGAMVEHQGMLNHLYAKINDLQLTQADSVAQTASQCFDISVWQFLAQLMIGGRIHIYSDEITRDPAKLLQKISGDQITIFETVPSMMRAILDDVAARGAAGYNLSALRWLIPTGEALPPDVARRWFDYYPNIPLLNAYGPTECSDDVTHYPIRQAPPPEMVNMPIGKPVGNMRMYVLDRHLQPVPVGVAGELHVGGIGVGRGYINDPQRTAEAFIADPFSPQPQARLYKTGDMARYLPDGNLEYLGRIDHQVKIRGFRIELGEIEVALNQHPGVSQAVVVAREDIPGKKRLVAYWVANAQAIPTNSQLRAYLKQRLPDYMVPAVWVLLPALPLNSNGKVDKRALPNPTGKRPELDQPYVSPQTELERFIAGIWGELLRLDRVGVYDRFFELGGSSIQAVQFIARLDQELGESVRLVGLFEAPSIAEFISYLQTRHAPALAKRFGNAAAVAAPNNDASNTPAEIRQESREQLNDLRAQRRARRQHHQQIV